MLFYPQYTILYASNCSLKFAPEPKDLAPATSNTSKKAFIPHNQCISLLKSRLFSCSCIYVDLNCHVYFPQHVLYNPNTSTRSNRHTWMDYGRQLILLSFKHKQIDAFIPHSQCISLLKSRSWSFTIHVCFDLNCHGYFSQHELHNSNTSTRSNMIFGQTKCRCYVTAIEASS